MPQFIQVEQRGNIKIVTLNRPDALNAISYKLAEEFHAVLDDVKYDMETRVLVITGTGRSFCAGADLKERQSYSPEERGRKTAEMCEIVTSLFQKIEMLEVPTIAAINGFCLGGGLELAISCDMRVVGDQCKLGFPEIDYGSYPGAGAPTMLPRIIPAAKAKELLFTGRRISAQEAKDEFGLVEKVVPQDQVLEAALALAEEIAQHAPIALRELKKAIAYGMTTTPELSRTISLWLRKSIDVSEDYQEGLRARNEKRKPVFKGR